MTPAKGLDELNRGAELGEGRDAQHVGVIQVEHALVGILGEQRVEHGAGLFAVLAEHVPFPDVVGALAPRQRLGVESDMADQVEGIEVLAQFGSDDGEVQALGL